MSSLLPRVAEKLNRLAGVSFRQTYLYRLTDEEWSGSPAFDASLNWKLLSPAGVGRLKEIGWFDENESLKRLQRGDRCYTASVDGRPAHYAWVQRSASHPITEAGVSVPVRNGAVWIYHCQTADWAKGRRIYPATLQRIVGDYFAEGESTAWIYTAKQNVASQKGIERAGFGLVATLHALRVGSHYHPFAENGKALAGLGLSEKSPERRRVPYAAVATERRRHQRV